MKRIIVLILSILIFTPSFSQGMQIQVQAGYGATLVNVKKITGDDKTIYNTYSYEFLLQALVKSKHAKLKWLPEIGMHRLYYYSSPTPTLRNGTVWTAHGGLGIERSILNYYYLQTGVNLSYFLDGSGLAPGLMGGIGFKIPVSSKFVIPLGVRLDILFAKAIPSSLCVCSGFQFGKRDR
jgi:hypothetical protein